MGNSTSALLSVKCPDGSIGCVQVDDSSISLSKLRHLLPQQLDEDCLPSSFYFSCNQIRIFQKQEDNVMVRQIIESKKPLVIVAKKRPATSLASQEEIPSKKARVTMEPIVLESSLQNNNNNKTDAVSSSSTPSSRLDPSMDLFEEDTPTHSQTANSPAAKQKDENNSNLSVQFPSAATTTPAVEQTTKTVSPLEEATNNNTNQRDNDDAQSKEPSSFENHSRDTRKNDHESPQLDSTPPTPKRKCQPIKTGDLDDEEPFQLHVESPVDPEPSFNTTTRAVVEATNAEHKKHDQVLEKSCQVLSQLQTLLNDNELFCSADRRHEFGTEITELLNDKDPPQTTIGVLGNTGVGKSSLLNALLDEASILPTSGSRGCTAAVVELRYNDSLLKKDSDAAVYQGQVEFMTLDHWSKELKVLIEESSTEEKKVYARTPDPQRQPDAAAAWSKINSVYGDGTMERFHGYASDRVYLSLVNNSRVKKLLTADSNNPKDNHSVFLQEGVVQPKDVERLLGGMDCMGRRLRNARKSWGKSFRKKINDYVYRKGNGREPQTWPLIRKVILKGPWSVLSTGACLVDLPGVRDSNAARAKVAEQYLQNCSQIWIAAPIKRAVDDGTAKELLGENFKRRLLMDGQYGNVSFICTQTDDVEATETMADHQDVAEKIGLWDEMLRFTDKIAAIEKSLSELQHDEDALKMALDDATDKTVEAKEEFDEKQKEGEESDETFLDSDEEVEFDASQVEELKRNYVHCKKTQKKCSDELKAWQREHEDERQNLQQRLGRNQSKLKTRCALVRNEYSKTCLQKDFRAGLEELTRDNDGEDSEAPVGPIPEDFEMDVYCISANDYLKVRGIKPASDGPPNTFLQIGDTQIPSLRNFVHDTTAKYRTTCSERFAERTGNLLDMIKLVAMDNKEVPSGRMARRLKSAFETEVELFEPKIQSVAETFRKKSEDKINTALRPALVTGAQMGKAAAATTVASWASKSKRSRHHERSPTSNGLHYMTYKATVRRSGDYVSASAGEVSMNQELVDPMEKAFSADWQRIMDSAIRVYLNDAEKKILDCLAHLEKKLLSAFTTNGLRSDRAVPLCTAAGRNSTAKVKNDFRLMQQLAAHSQRNLNRSLLPKVRDRMTRSYDAALAAPGGSGVFRRMDHCMQTQSGIIVHTMFSESTNELLSAISKLICDLAVLVQQMTKSISKDMQTVFSILWEAQRNNSNVISDPAQQALVRACRDKLLPKLNEFSAIQNEVFDTLGMEREQLELDVVGVESFNDKLNKQMKEAEEKGLVVDLVCDSDEDDEWWEEFKKAGLSSPSKAPQVKQEPHIG